MSKKETAGTEELIVRPSAEVGEAIDFGADAGAGLDYGQGDLAIPYLAVLQDLSPQVKEENGKYVDGARPGMIFNTVTGQVYKGRIAPKNDDGKTAGVIVIPSAYQKKFVEWTPRDSGGGFVASFNANDPEVKAAVLNDKGKLITKAGNLLVETAYHYVVLVGEEGPEWAVISMASSQLKTSRKWNTLTANLRVQTPGGARPAPLFSCQYRLSTKLEQKDQNSWFGWDVASVGFITDRNLYNYAKEYSQAVIGGMVKAATPVDESANTESAGGQSGDVPF